MVHLFLALPPQSIRLEPYVTTVNQVPSVRAAEVDLAINPEATVDCLPGVASYVGADITSHQILDGRWTQPKFFDSVLTDAQILDICLDGKTDVSPSVDWGTTEGSGDTIDDASSNELDGTITGSSWSTQSPSKTRSDISTARADISQARAELSVARIDI